MMYTMYIIKILSPLDSSFSLWLRENQWYLFDAFPLYVKAETT